MLLFLLGGVGVRIEILAFEGVAAVVHADIFPGISRKAIAFRDDFDVDIVDFFDNIDSEFNS